MIKKKDSRIYLGTSGWIYAHWSGIFYPSEISQNKWLEYYTQYFDTVELNSSFYHLPKENTFINWRKRTPPNFLFSLKASRYITHIKKLREAKDAWKKFIKNAQLLKEKLGPILFQLPPYLKIDLEVLEKFLKTLPPKYRYVFEPRNKTWYSPSVYQLFKKFNVSLCISSTPNYPSAEVITSDFLYLRLHGSKELYSSKYTTKELTFFAKKIKKWIKSGLDVYVYFDNDAFGYAVENALELKGLLKDFFDRK